MFKDPAKNRLAVIYFISYVLIGAVCSRMIPYYLGTSYQWVVIGLLAGFLLLFSTERLISRKLPGYIHFYFVLQIGIRVALLLIPTFGAPQDYFTNLLLLLSAQAIWHLPERVGVLWVGVFALLAAGTMIGYYRNLEGIGFALTYVAGIVLVSAFTAMTQRADRARQESQALLAELQVANRKLEEYARQAEELAAVQERNRLARELHDVVSQIIFSMTLTAQAARILLDRDPSRVPAQLDHLQTLSQNALAEMRALIQHLHPGPAGEGLAPALRRQAAERLAREGLEVVVQASDEVELPEAVEEGLLRITQEALNNVVKHAGVKQAFVTLDAEGSRISLCIEDHGSGFDAAALAGRPGRLGLANIAERAQGIGGALTVDSAPGMGTRIRVELDRVKEGEHV